MGCHFLFQEIFPTQGSSWSLLQVDSIPLSRRAQQLLKLFKMFYLKKQTKPHVSLLRWVCRSYKQLSPTQEAHPSLQPSGSPHSRLQTLAENTATIQDDLPHSDRAAVIMQTGRTGLQQGRTFLANHILLQLGDPRNAEPPSRVWSAGPMTAGCTSWICWGFWDERRAVEGAYRERGMILVHT